MKSDAGDLDTLDRDQCLALLRSVPVGRIVYTDQALPAIQPVAFTMDGDHAVIIRTGPGSKLDAALRGTIVAFEADDLDAVTRTGWAVTVVGQARAVTSAPERQRLSCLPVRPWAPGRRDHFIRIACDHMSGRRLSPVSAPGEVP